MRIKHTTRIMALATLFLWTSLASSGVMAASQDKGLHLSGSYILTNLMMEEGMTRTQAFFLTLAIGVAKESLDRHNSPTEHLQDLGANVLGATGGIIFFEYSPKNDPVW